MKYFSHKELASKDNDVVQLDPNFERELLIYRETVNHPLYVNSCCRSVAHNKKVGGASRSYHLYEGVDDGRHGTLAIDLKVTDSAKRAKMVRTALDLNWSVGVYKSFIHIDRRVDIGKPQILFWGKY